MKDPDRVTLEAHLEVLEAALNDIRTAVGTLNSILPMVCKARRPDPAEAGRQVKPAALTTFDVYYADGRGGSRQCRTKIFERGLPWPPSRTQIHLPIQVSLLRPHRHQAIRYRQHRREKPKRSAVDVKVRFRLRMI